MLLTWMLSFLDRCLQNDGLVQLLIYLYISSAHGRFMQRIQWSWRQIRREG